MGGGGSVGSRGPSLFFLSGSWPRVPEYRGRGTEEGCEGRHHVWNGQQDWEQGREGARRKGDWGRSGARLGDGQEVAWCECHRPVSLREGQSSFQGHSRNGWWAHLILLFISLCFTLAVTSFFLLSQSPPHPQPIFFSFHYPCLSLSSDISSPFSDTFHILVS